MGPHWWLDRHRFVVPRALQIPPSLAWTLSLGPGLENDLSLRSQSPPVGCSSGGSRAQAVSIQSCEIYGYSIALGSAGQMGLHYHNKLKCTD